MRQKLEEEEKHGEGCRYTQKKKIERKKVIEGKEIGERMKIKVLWDTTPC
jgi:hypothetical protein